MSLHGSLRNDRLSFTGNVINDTAILVMSGVDDGTARIHGVSHTQSMMYQSFSWILLVRAATANNSARRSRVGNSAEAAGTQNLRHVERGMPNPRRSRFFIGRVHPNGLQIKYTVNVPLFWCFFVVSSAGPEN
jgi:hypothetical protein